jgi:tetratricopeptide (TPR) repeat protein
MTRPRSQIAVLAGACISLATAIGLQVVRDTAYPLRARTEERLLYVDSGPALKRMALEFDDVAADVYWIRAIQHYGGERLTTDRARKFELLQPLLDLTTSLDPYFTIAYRFGAIFLSEAYPGGPGRPDQAIALLQKGIAAQPGKWQYYYDIAFVQYWHLNDPSAAADWFQRAANQSNAPNWLRPLAATMLSANDRRSARFMWQQILQSDQPWLRRTAERSLLQLDAMDQIERLQRVVDQSRAAGAPITWADLVRRRVLPGVPVDPSGAPFDIDGTSGRVTVSPRSPLFPMPDLMRAPR